MQMHGEDDAYQQRVQQEQATMPIINAATVVAQPASGNNPDPRPLPERAEADRQVRAMSDAQALEAVGGSSFNHALYLQQNPDVAAHPVWGRDPARHYLAYGQFEGRPYPGTPPAAPAPAAAVQVRQVYSVPSLPTIPADLFPKAVATPIAPAPASSMPIMATPLTPSSPSLVPNFFAPDAPAPAPAAAAVARSALPKWALPASIAAAALLVAVPLIKRARSRR